MRFIQIHTYIQNSPNAGLFFYQLIQEMFKHFSPFLISISFQGFIGLPYRLQELVELSLSL